MELAVLAVMLVATANLRGIRESGNIFALPTYLFMFSALLAIGIGVFNTITGNVQQLAAQEHALKSSGEALTILLIGRAFASGSVALTGVEAIADGVPSFKPPEAKNAANTLVAMAVILGVLFVGPDLRRDPVRRRAHGRQVRPHGPGPGWRRRCSATAAPCSCSCR